LALQYKLVWGLSFMILSSLLSTELSRSDDLVINLIWFLLKLNDKKKKSYLVILEDVLFRIHTYDRSDKLKLIYILFFSIFFWIFHSSLSFAGNRYSYFLFLSMQLSHSNLIFTLLINKIIKIFLEYCKDMFS